MGKTALVTQLVRHAQEYFDGIIWFSLRNAPPLEALVTECLSAFPSQQEPYLFGGDIANFLHTGEHIFSNIRDLLDEQFERLSLQEKRLLYWLAVGRELASLDELISDIRRASPGQHLCLQPRWPATDQRQR